MRYKITYYLYAVKKYLRAVNKKIIIFTVEKY